MDRFPRSSRARAAALLLTGGLLVAGAVPPSAHADDPQPGGPDLTHRQRQVQRQLTGVHDDLDESSAQVRDAAAALEQARSQLATAQVRLADTRGRLAAARATDQRTAAELTAASARLRRARADLVAGRQRVTDQQDTLGRIVVATYQGGDPSLLGLSMVLTTQDPTQLTGQLNSVGNVMDKEQVVLDRLDASRAMLVVQQHEVAAARARVADRRRQAATELARRQSLESAAEAAETSVSGLVDARASARAQARQARTADLAQLASLRTEQDRIAAVLKRRADAARARAAAAAGSTAGQVDSGPVASQRLGYPVVGPVTSPFGWRIHPIYHYRSLHDGVDFGVACGTPIRASAAGTVVERYAQTAWGNRVVIDHGIHHGVALATISSHMETPAVVAPGQHVARGQVVGYVGTTGWSTGCHLHFTVLQNGVAVDPMTWF